MDTDKETDVLAITQYAWAAGIFEGEGCLTWTNGNAGVTRPDGSSRHRAYPAISMGMTDEDMVRRFADIMEIGKITMPKKRENRKQQWQWRAFGLPAVQHLDKTIGPFLGKRRRAKLDEMLMFVPLREPGTKKWLGPRILSDESREAIRLGLERGRQKNTKLSPDVVVQIRACLDAGLSYRAVAARFNCSPSAVWSIKFGHTWSHVDRETF